MAQKFFTYGDENVGPLLSTTVSEWIQTTLEDNVFSQTPLLTKLFANKRTLPGGASILAPIMFETNSTTTWYTMYDQLDVTPQEGFTNSQAKWRNIANSISIAGEEMRQNSGQAKIIDLMEGKTMQAELTIANDITAALFAATTGTKKLESLVPMIDATSTIQDINSTNQSFWQAVVTASGSFATQGLSDMRSTWSTVVKRNPRTIPDIVVTTSDIFDAYEGSIINQQRYSVGDRTGNGSFDGLKFKTADIFFDAQCTSGVIYMFPSQNLRLVLNSNADHKKTEFVKPSNQDAMVAQVIVMLQMVTNARRKLAKLTGVTTT